MKYLPFLLHKLPQHALNSRVFIRPFVSRKDSHRQGMLMLSLEFQTSLIIVHSKIFILWWEHNGRNRKVMGKYNFPHIIP